MSRDIYFNGDRTKWKKLANSLEFKAWLNISAQPSRQAEAKAKIEALLASSNTLIENEFGKIWPVHLTAFTHLLIQLRAHFDGDLESMIIMAVIGERTRPGNWTPELRTYRQLTSKPGEEHLQVPINLQSVADFSGIPRETVRRKVKILQERGWVKRDGKGRLAIASGAARDLEQATMDSVIYLERLLAVLEKTRT